MEVPELYKEINEMLTFRLLPPRNQEKIHKIKGRRNTFGFINHRMKYYKPPHLSAMNAKYAEIYNALRRLGDAIVPFAYDGITVNQNNVCPLHYDKGNLGSSLIVSGGEYEGGELRIEKGIRTSGPVGEWEEIDTCYNPFVFDGHRRHWNNDITSGFKWSVVFFKLEILPKWLPAFPTDVNDPNREYSLIDL